MHRKPHAMPDPREIIRMLRDLRGFPSDRALAIAAGIPQPALHRYLSGEAQAMEVASFQALASVLDVTLSELLGEVPISAGGRIRELVNVWEQLGEAEQRALLAAGKAMADTHKADS